MGQLAQILSRSSEGASVSKAGHSLKKRLQAWWEGYDLPTAASENASNITNPSAENGQEIAPVPEWPRSRQELVQMMWGNGCSIPGETEFILNLVKPFGLTEENTLLAVGAGLGGGTRTVASKMGTYIEGLELDSGLVARAQEFALIYGLEKKVDVKALVLEKLDLKPNYYDAAIIRETLMAVEDKALLFEKVLNAVKPGSSVVIADFFLADSTPGPAAKAALDAENRKVYPADPREILDKMDPLEFELRVDIDETPTYTAEVRSGLSGFAKRLKTSELPDDMIDALMRETELWRLRRIAFEAGELQMRRIMGFKRTDTI